MNAARKVDTILNAWLEYIDLDDYSSARVEAGKHDKVKQRRVNLLGDRVLIEEAIFSELQKQVKQGQKPEQDTTWVLSFPQIIDVEKGKSYLCPLFSLDVTPILKGEYQEQGWKLDRLKLTEAGDNLAIFLGLDDEQREKLITQNGLREFLETTFEFEFSTYEQWMQQVIIPRSKFGIQRQPYLFKWDGGRFSKNLKQDFKDIQSGSKNWLKGHATYEYLFGEPQPPKHKVTYMGAFPTHPPADSQLTAIKHSQSEPVTAVQGPPGSGKTTLILHVIAQQVVKRALSLIETDEDINNLTVVSSTNNKAVDNVIERIDKELEGELFYLKGGSKKNIDSDGGASEKLQEAINYFKSSNFDKNSYDSIKEQIQQIKDELLTEESNYLKLRSQIDSDEERLPQLQELIQTLQQHLEEALSTKEQYQLRSEELANYEELPIEAYRKIQLRFGNAERQLPEGRLPWWVHLWRWITRKTERNIIQKAALACESAIDSTLSTPFPVRNPIDRSDLIQEANLVRERLANAEELQSVQKRLREVIEDIATTEQQNDAANNELINVENRLGVPLEDFYATFHQNFHDKHKELFELSREFLLQQALSKKNDVKVSLEKYSSLLSEFGRAKYRIADDIAKNLDENIQNLSLVFPLITSTLLSIRNMLPWVEECIDRTIVDEAGMIPQHQTFPILVRSRKAIIVGDPLQIEPIISLSDQRRDDYRQTAFLDKRLTETDYRRYSPEEEYRATTYHRAAGASGEDGDKGKGIQLKEHYRCQRSIIEYCDRIAGYDGLKVLTKPTSPLLEKNLIAYHVEGNIINNVNQEEVTAVCELVQHVLNQGYSIEDIGVISAFRLQADTLEKNLRQKFPRFDRNSVGTVHTFQGAEKKIIIFSPRVSRLQDNSKLGWINKRPNLLNVAVSRAQELFILVGNLDRLEKGKLTRQLVEHIREQGVILEYKSEAEIPQPEPGAITIHDCDHLSIFRDAISQAERELIIVTPWIRGNEPKKFVNDIVSALEREVKVTVIYGNKSGEEHDNNDPQAEKKLKDLFSQYPGSNLICLGREIHIESRGTNERILVCDDKFAIVGSWNWLSHHYRESCRRLLIKPNVQIRRETSIQFSSSSSIADIKTRVNKLITQ